jgi:protein involved in polysaccharide export with SLBB domain
MSRDCCEKSRCPSDEQGGLNQVCPCLSVVRDPSAASIDCREWFAVVLVCLLVSACAQAAGKEMQASAAIRTEPGAQVDRNATRLEQLREQRNEDAFSNKLAIGPGDVIEVTVPGVPELDKLKVRVSEDNTISLPLVGVVPVGGMTEEGLRAALYRRLEKPVKNPQVEVFVVRYLSREVAVVGMVQKPGLYSIASRTDTVLDMINQAGGMTAQASSRVLFIPASSSSSLQRIALARSLSVPAAEAPQRAGVMRTNLQENYRESADAPDRVAAGPLRRGLSPDSSTGQGRLLSLVGATDPIEIELTSARRERDLDVPVRPGDTIIVPAAGEVMVDGWVQNPGAFRIVPGMTALSAVSAAGGALFSQTAEVLRTNSDGSRMAIPVALAEVKAGKEPDVPVQAGDIVVVERSALGAVPYAFYEIFTKFGTGLYAPVP